jgi:two-component system, chemotaxis family, sensor kinase CheA
MDAAKLTKLVAMFKNEAVDHIAVINRELLAIERAPSDEAQNGRLEEIFRAAHSLKGAARTVGFSQVETLAHQLESVLGQARNGELELTSQVCDDLYRSLDAITNILQQSTEVEWLETVSRNNGELEIAVPQSEPSNGKSGPRAVAAALNDETIRVNIGKLEDLMAQASELLIFKITAEQRLAELKQIRTGFRNQHKAYQKSQLAHSDLNSTWLSELYARLAGLEHQLTNDTLQLGIVIDSVQDNIRQARMLPFDSIVGGFQRMVRDLAHQLGKDVVLEIEGEATEVDKKILEAVRDPIMHLLGNAIDHGIELPEERRYKQKPPQSRIRLTFRQVGNFMTITVEDDGRGLDLVAIRDTVTNAEAYSEHELAGMTEAEIAHLILLPGISTHHQVTHLSGRGVGLDVVRHKIESLHGQIEIQTQADLGTCFTLKVPLTLATAHGLLVKVADEIYVIPVSAVTKIVIAHKEDVQTINGRDVLSVNGVPTALVHLAEIVELPTNQIETGDLLRCVVLHTGEVQIAFVVDELVGEQELVLKSLGKQLAHVPNIAGATLLGTGDVVIILNPAEIIRAAQGKSSRVPVVSRNQETETIHTILVVDDSITTRTLEKNILEAAGYHVVTAMNGLEALRYLQYNHCDLVVSDVQMPLMDGIELAQTVKKSATLNHLPLILVTSLEAQADRERGMTAGANAYIVKSGFDQDDLLSTIRQLL